MEVGSDDKAASEILRSLLITPKMENSQASEVNDWRQTDENEQIVWQIETSGTNKQNFVSDIHIDNHQNVIQAIPITYLTPNDRNLTFPGSRTLIKPLTYILSRNDFTEPPKYCIDCSEGNVIVSEPQQIVLVQNANAGALEPSETFGIVESLTKKSIKGIEYRNVISGKKRKKENVDDKRNETSKTKKSSDAALLKRKKRDSRQDICSSVKPKVDKKESNNKKCLRKKKSKPTSKLKEKGKPLAKNSVKTINCDNEDDENIMEDEITRKNLFELIDLEDNVDQVAERLKVGCDCADSNCFDGLNPEKVFRHRLNIADLTKAEHDMYLMGVIMASVQNLQETSRHKERIRIRSCYAYEGKKICLTAFLYLQHVTLYQMKRLRSHLKMHGVSPRIHGNRGRKPSNTFSLDIYRCATNFVQSYIEKRCTKSVPNFTTFSSNKIGNNFISGSKLPSAKQGINKKSSKVKMAGKTISYYLPSECTKKTVHNEYILFCERLEPGQKVMKYSTFTSFLQQQFPNVKFPKTDKKPAVKYVQAGHFGNFSRENKNKVKGVKDKTEGHADKNIQTPSVVYVPTKTLRLVQPTFQVAPKQPPQLYGKAQIINSLAVRDPQTVLNSKQIQNLSGGNGSDLHNISIG